MEEKSILDIKNDINKHYAKREYMVNNRNEYNNSDLFIKNENGENNEYKINNHTSIFKKCIVFFIITIVFCIITYKYLPSEIQDNKYVVQIKNQYDYVYGVVKLQAQKYISPNVKEKLKEEYYKAKKYMIDYNYKLANELGIDNTVMVFNPLDNIEFEKNTTQIKKVEAVSSELSLMNNDVNEIKEKNIDIKLPVEGVVTSVYGAREEIFENVGYHTGLDIANDLNTVVRSATTGVVVKAEVMHLYYGNNIEIETNGVIFKYAHLNMIEVNEGEIINQGDEIGLMGSTGASTGPHLHFEIRINGRTVDPEFFVDAW